MLELMKGVDISKACGYDGAGNKIINLCSEGLRVYFIHFFLFVSLTGSVPERMRAWKFSSST